MLLSFDDFTADGVHAFLARQAEAGRAEEAAHAARARMEREKLRAAFEQRDLLPDAQEGVLALVQQAMEADPHAKEVMVQHVPSEFMADSGRSITSHDPDWAK